TGPYRRLSLQIHLGVQTAVRSGDRLGGLVGLEPRVEGFLALLVLLTAKSPVAEHQVVVRRQVLRVDAQGVLELGDRRRMMALQEEDAPDLVAHDAIAREAFGRRPEVQERL